MDRAALRRRLLAWFRKHRRSLPWRQDRDPYRIWVSEIMLQQTQVAAVIPYFERFLRSFPTLHALAGATEQEVLRRWEGLGYYRRARGLHESARLLLAEHQGRFPRDPAVLGKLPGFGRYTVGAVLSQAFDCRLPILEANSRRLLCRMFGIRGDPRRNKIEERLWRLAEELLPARGVGDFNQALMELGALVCTPARPGCERCPLRGQCTAHRLRLADKIPRRSRAAPVEDLAEVAVVVRRGRRVLLVQRPTKGRWAGLWEFPHGSPLEGEDAQDCARRLLAGLAGIHAQPEQMITTIRHAIMRWRITLDCLQALYQSGRFHSDFYTHGRWVTLGDLHNYPVSAPQRRLVQTLCNYRRSGFPSLTQPASRQQTGRPASAWKG
jgi:A/G-specific adenine glycosylase